ncbi:kielin/chordin-like protein [Nilaparvata lugens]|uniref:kielin/chordin-like protein n=1 Tax=Nilaparvata lugens TaxID=108931 RepID=UPI00193CD5F9|nr:kielin/chordin-like protein [Nilaparvata lugens]
MDVLRVLLIVQTLAVSSIYVLAEDKRVGLCKNNNLRHYEELGCTPVIDQESGCIVSYDCSLLSNRKEDKCHYRGKEYSFNEELPSEMRGSCEGACYCSNHDGRGNFECAIVECGDEIFRSEKKEDDCMRQYSHDSCCSFCKEVDPGVNCKYGDKVFREGQQFYPEEESCKKCICMTGFNGSLVSPYCVDISCGIELHHSGDIMAGCTPVYYGDDGCCPISSHCPTETDKIVEEDLTVENKDGAPKCQFGDLDMEIGQRLVVPIKERCLECSCKVPPFISCAINTKCYKNRN